MTDVVSGAAFAHALVRGIPDSYGRWSTLGRPVSVELARGQIRHYVRHLEDLGLHVHRVPADEAHFDCVFIEDTAIVWRDQALISRMGSHREGEQDAVREILARTHGIHDCTAPALIEGGDVLHAGDVTYVGLTTRTNEAGAHRLAELLRPFGRRVVTIPVDALHLKTAATYLGAGVLVGVPGVIDFGLFEVDDVIVTAPDEAGAANCLRVRDTVFVAAGYPETEERVRSFAGRQGVEVVVLAISEFEKADGSLTCLSLLW